MDVQADKQMLRVPTRGTVGAILFVSQVVHVVFVQKLAFCFQLLSQSLILLFEIDYLPLHLEQLFLYLKYLAILLNFARLSIA